VEAHTAEGVSRQRHDLKGADPVAWLNQAGDLQVVSFIRRVLHMDAVCEEEPRLDAGDKQLLAPGGVDLGVFKHGGEAAWKCVKRAAGVLPTSATISAALSASWPGSTTYLPAIKVSGDPRRSSIPFLSSICRHRGQYIFMGMMPTSLHFLS